MLHNHMFSRCNKNAYEHCVFLQDLIEQPLKERLEERAGRTVNAGDGNAEEVAVKNTEVNESETYLLDTGINEDIMKMSLPDCCLSDEE